LGVCQSGSDRWTLLTPFMLTAILVAAGSSSRMGFDKLFSVVGGKTVISHTIDAFERTGSVTGIIVVARGDRRDEFERLVREQKWRKIETIVAGGEHRHDSVRAGLNRLNAGAQYVAVHDAARPLVTPEQIERVYQASRDHAAATLAEPISDTLKRAGADLAVVGSVDRHQLYAMQTPQIFERQLLEKAYRAVAEKKISVTDEVSAVELLGHKIALVLNDDFNFKITYPRDLLLAEFILQKRAQS
jgi:2-C-methyl-D-erythritol 4-phosphate cytidylyltransferase